MKLSELEAILHQIKRDSCGSGFTALDPEVVIELHFGSVDKTSISSVCFLDLTDRILITGETPK